MPPDKCLDSFPNESASTLVDALGSKLERPTGMNMREALDLDLKICRILSDLRFHQNSLLPINTLPNEILAYILELTVSTSPFHDFPEKFTGICRKWRSVSTADASLWSVIRITAVKKQPEHYASMYAARSCSIPVTVAFFGTLGLIIEQWKKFLHNLSFRIIGLKFDSEEVFPFIQDLSLPILENLHAKGSVHFAPSALPSLFGGKLPRLRHLYLERYTAWPPGLFSGLTSLHLQHQFQSEDVSMSLLLDLLEASPLLEELNVAYYRPHEDSVPARVISLPKLSELQLMTCACWLILSHLYFPSSANITLVDSLRFADNGNQYQTDLYSSIPQHWDYGDTISRTTDLRFEFNQRDLFLQTKTADGCLMKISDRNFPRRPNRLKHLIADTFRTFTSPSTLPFLTTFTFVSEREVPIGTHVDWKYVFDNLQALQHLSICVFPEHTLLRDLSGEEHDCPLPALISLKLTGFVPTAASEQRVWFGLVASMLKGRSARGCPIHEVEFLLKSEPESIGINLELLSDIGELVRPWKQFGVKRLKLLAAKWMFESGYRQTSKYLPVITYGWD